MKFRNACIDCPILKGKEGKPPCYDDNGLFLGSWTVSSLACEYVIERKKEHGIRKQK